MAAKRKWREASGRERGVLVPFRKRTRSTFYHVFFFLFLILISAFCLYVCLYLSICLRSFLSGWLFLFRLTVNTVFFLCWPHTDKCINHWTGHFNFHSRLLFYFKREIGFLCCWSIGLHSVQFARPIGIFDGISSSLTHVAGQQVNSPSLKLKLNWYCFILLVSFHAYLSRLARSRNKKKCLKKKSDWYVIHGISGWLIHRWCNQLWKYELTGN